MGATCPHNLEAVWATPPPPRNFGLLMSLIFFLHVNLGLSQKIVGQIRGDLSFG